MSEPVFAVACHVNKGKSSIVSALAEDDSVAIAYEARTTTESQPFALRVGDETLLTLVDTPGFEQARHALAWMQARETSAVGRAEVVAAFVREHEQRGEFQEECRLLRPILDGAGILYVVDGSRPFSAEYEAEMEILRWTGQPRLAMINKIGERDYVAQWRAALDQYFNLVHEFDAHQADYALRLQVLYACRELRAEWRPALDRAIELMQREHARRLEESARAIAAMLVDQLSLRLDIRIAEEALLDPHKAQLQERYRHALRDRERRCREQIEDLYRHRRVRRQESELNPLTDDLFSEATWLRFGLTREQLATTGAVGGAIVGGGIDAALAGHSFLLGTVIGGAIGGLTAWFSRETLATVKIKGLKLGGRLLQIGPMRNPQFPWIVLDRAMLHHQLIRRRSHARRDELILDSKDRNGISTTLSLAQRKRFESVFQRAIKAADHEQKDAVGFDLAALIKELLKQA